MHPDFLQYTHVAISALIDADDLAGSEAADTLSRALRGDAGARGAVERALSADGFESHEIVDIVSTLYFHS